MQLIVAERGDPEAVGNTFLTLRRVRDLFADRYRDGVYTFRDPTGAAHTFSLERWKDRDPDSTYLQIGFRYSSRASLVGRKSLFP